MEGYYYLDSAINIYYNMDTEKVFNKILREEYHMIVNDVSSFDQMVTRDELVIYKKKNEWVEDNYMWIINIPFRFRKTDNYTKSFQFIRGYGKDPSYTIRIMNNTDKRELFTVSGIRDGKGNLGIKFDRNIDKDKLGDPKINNGTYLLQLGMCISYIMGVQKINLGDQATVNCDNDDRYDMSLTLMKKLNGEMGFYEKQGFSFKNDISIYIESVREATTDEVLNAAKIENIDIPNMKVKDYVRQIMSINGKKGEKICKQFSGFLKSIQNTSECDHHDERTQDMCMIMKNLKEMMNSQIKVLSYEDVYKLF